MVNHPALQKDLAKLKNMVDRLNSLQDKLQDSTLPHHEHQIISAAIVSLTELIEVTSRDVKRKLEGS